MQELRVSVIRTGFAAGHFCLCYAAMAGASSLA
jgi:hypothetical protein